MTDEHKPCTYTLEDGTHYDLNGLSSGSKDYDAQSGGSEPVYRLNVCRNVLTELSHVENAAKVGAFFERADGKGHFSIGEFTTNITISPGTHDPLLVYQNGSPCPSNENDHSSTAIRFICDQTEFGAGQPRLVAALPPGQDACHFFFEWPTHVACPASQKASLDGGLVATFLAFVAIALLTWFGGHTLYNRFYLGRRGAAVFPIPQCSRPRKLRLPGAGDADPSEAPTSRRWGFGFRRSQRAGYSHLRAEPDEEDALAASRFSLDSDDAGQDDAHALGGEVDAWRGHSVTQGHGRASDEGGRVGVHQGLVDL